jgi:membrane-associated phospholipid phosphatase
MSRLTRLPRRAGLFIGMTGLLFGSAVSSAQTQDNSGASASQPKAAPNTGASVGSPNTATGAAAASSSTDTGPTKGADSSDADTGPAGREIPTYTESPDSNQQTIDPHPLWHDIEAYYTSPLHWDGKDWAYLGGSLALLAAAHHYDTQVRTHFIAEGAKPIGGSTKDLQDALPMVAGVAGTWLYANLTDSSPGLHEAWNMVEAGGLSVVDSYALKIVAGRERPDQTSDPNKWRASGSSFPSFHAAAAFAIGAVLAESGNDDYRFIRRFLGYGAIAGFTAFERLKHNAHWLSDDVAGAEIGGATAHFVLERDAQKRESRSNYTVSLVPEDRGAMLTYSLDIR